MRLFVGEEPYFKRRPKGSRTPPADRGGRLRGEVISAVPVKRNGAVTGVLIGVVGNIGKFQLTNSIVTGETDSICLLKNDGSILAGNSSGSSSGNFFQLVQPLDRSEDLERMKADFLSGTPGFGAFRLGGVPMLAAYSAIRGRTAGFSSPRPTTTAPTRRRTGFCS